MGVPSTGVSAPKTAVLPPVPAGVQAWLPQGAPGLGAPEKVVFHDFAFEDGYAYRQYDNGDVQIIASPKGTPPVAVITKTSNPNAWRAITAAIQAKKSAKTAQTVAIFATAAAVAATAIIAATAKAPEKPHRHVRRPLPPRPARLPEVEPPFPWVPVGLGLAALVGVLAIARARGG
jgi:hypothetical protein